MIGIIIGIIITSWCILKLAEMIINLREILKSK